MANKPYVQPKLRHRPTMNLCNQVPPPLAVNSSQKEQEIMTPPPYASTHFPNTTANASTYTLARPQYDNTGPFANRPPNPHRPASSSGSSKSARNSLSAKGRANKLKEARTGSPKVLPKPKPSCLLLTSWEKYKHPNAGASGVPLKPTYSSTPPPPSNTESTSGSTASTSGSTASNSGSSLRNSGQSTAVPSVPKPANQHNLPPIRRPAIEDYIFSSAFNPKLTRAHLPKILPALLRMWLRKYIHDPEVDAQVSRLLHHHRHLFYNGSTYEAPCPAEEEKNAGVAHPAARNWSCDEFAAWVCKQPELWKSYTSQVSQDAEDPKDPNLTVSNDTRKPIGEAAYTCVTTSTDKHEDLHIKNDTTDNRDADHHLDACVSKFKDIHLNDKLEVPPSTPKTANSNGSNRYQVLEDSQGDDETVVGDDQTDPPFTLVKNKKKNRKSKKNGKGCNKK